MRIRKKMLSVFCAAMLLGVITSVTVPQVQASDEQTKKFLHIHSFPLSFSPELLLLS